MSEPRLTIILPGMLAELVGGERRIEVAGASLREALEDLVRQRPGLGLHLFDEAGKLRRHILCFCNDTYTRTELDVALDPGDTITILHAVSGG